MNTKANEGYLTLFFVSTKYATDDTPLRYFDGRDPINAVNLHESGKTLSHAEILDKISDKSLRDMLKELQKPWMEGYGPLSLLFISKSDAENAMLSSRDVDVEKDKPVVREFRIPCNDKSAEIKGVPPEKNCTNCMMRMIDENESGEICNGCIFHPGKTLNCYEVCDKWTASTCPKV